MDFSKEDWNLFRSKLPDWQEAYMERLNKEYIQILSSEGKASDKFWELEKRIYQDKRSPGVIVQLRRRDMPIQLTSLLRDGAITRDDLKEFSPELQEYLGFLLGENRKK
ncbi:MAG: multidrug transporter [Firmicutes bacterium]|nr:multidrug transporter [Bacillota bacterium]MDY6160766.1 multidrug transporter [Candidatus Faecousia sp.]